MILKVNQYEDSWIVMDEIKEVIYSKVDNTAGIDSYIIDEATVINLLGNQKQKDYVTKILYRRNGVDYQMFTARTIYLLNNKGETIERIN